MMGGKILRLENKVAVITGSSLGIGSAIALAFAKEGAAVAVDYRSHPDEAKEIVDQVEGSGSKAISVHADVSSPEDVKNLIRKAVEEFGRLDVMVNNAGTEEKMPFLETPLDVWNRIIAVNLTGAWLGCQEAARQMVSKADQDASLTSRLCTRICRCRPTPPTAPPREA
jgi:glucose 1-dehydrogenase